MPSSKDLLRLAEPAELLDMDGVPALMAISDEGVRIDCASLIQTDAIAVVVVAEAIQ